MSEGSPRNDTPEGAAAVPSGLPGPSGPRGVLGALDATVRGLDTVAVTLAILCVFVMIVMGVADSLGILLNRPVLATVEVIQVFLAAAVFLALGHAQRMGHHIKVDLIIDRFPPRLLCIQHIVALALTFFIFTLIAWLAMERGLRAMAIREVSAGYLPVPVWIAKMTIAIGAGIAALESARQLVWALAGRNAIEAEAAAAAGPAADAEIDAAKI